MRGDLLIGADGLWSPVRASIRTAAPRYSGYTAWRGVSPVSIDTGHLTYTTKVGYPAEFKAQVGFLLDPLSSMWLLFVTGVGTLIHIYSVGYMAHEGGYYRFFGYLNLFMFSMLTLILANNTECPYKGEIQNALNQVDPRTGTLELQASFSNPQHRLLPGQFGRVRFRITERQTVIVVPQSDAPKSLAASSSAVSSFSSVAYSGNTINGR